jgi:hypothetical protein
MPLTRTARQQPERRGGVHQRRRAGQKVQVAQRARTSPPTRRRTGFVGVLGPATNAATRSSSSPVDSTTRPRSSRRRYRWRSTVTAARRNLNSSCTYSSAFASRSSPAAGGTARTPGPRHRARPPSAVARPRPAPPPRQDPGHRTGDQARPDDRLGDARASRPSSRPTSRAARATASRCEPDRRGPAGRRVVARGPAPGSTPWHDPPPRRSIAHAQVDLSQTGLSRRAG